MDARIRGGRITRWLERRSALGMVVAALCSWLSLTPSLLPRTWVMQGVVSGVAFALGYAIGLAAQAGLARVGWWSPRIDRWRVRIGWAMAVILPLELVLSLRYRAHDFELLGFDTTERVRYAGVLVVAAVVVAVLGSITWLLRRLVRWVERRLHSRVPSVVASVGALLVVAFAVAFMASRTLHHVLVQGANDAMQWRDTNVADDEPDAPTSPLRSAGPGSALSWEESGFEGRRFLSRGPDAEEIERRSGQPALDPIRVYVGRAAADDFAEAATLAVDELDRTGAFDRDALLLVTPTGTGWMNEQFIAPFEYLVGGDTAVVAVQYSHLPSVYAVLDDPEAATDSARALFSAVDERLRERPERDRPRLYVAGESLGSYGGAGVFDDLDDMVERAAGGVWTGAPPINHLRREAERRRDPGSLQIHPAVADLPELAFGQDADAFDRPGIRFAFLQNADDPFMWWDASLAVRRPDWLEEPLDPRVNPTLRWVPLVTWLQVGADVAVANSFEQGQGHLYGALPLEAWLGILDHADWDADEVEALRERMQDVER